MEIKQCLLIEDMISGPRMKCEWKILLLAIATLEEKELQLKCNEPIYI